MSNNLDYSVYIEEKPKEIQILVNKILNHPLIIGQENRNWIQPENRNFNCSDGGCLDFNKLEDSVKGISYIIEFLQKYNPKKILEVGMNAGTFSIIAKIVLNDVQIFTIDRVEEFEKRKNIINNFFSDNFINLFIGDSNSTEFKNWCKKFKPFDLAWIDGNHEEENALNDIETAIINQTKIIVCDDAHQSLPTGVWNAIKKLETENRVKIISDSNILSTVGSIILLKNLEI